MSRRKVLTPSIWLLAMAGGLFTGCLPVRSPVLRNYFVPPAAKPPEGRFVAPEPPPLDASLVLRALPMPLDAVANDLGQSGRVEILIHEAEAHFQAGRRLYQEGDAEAARLCFDQAVDVLLAAPERLPGRAHLEKKLEELVEAIHRMDVAGLGAGDIAPEPGFQKPPLEEIPQLTFPVDSELRHKVLEQVRATGSQLPLDVNEAVLAYIQYFASGRGRKILVAGLERGGRYRPLIQRILDEEGLPPELIHYAQAESGFQPRAVSRKRATGMWQFVRWRGREYGLTQTPFVDERLDPEKSTRAAARHLRDLYEHFGDWYLAMAAYNCGPGVIERAVERTGYADFWELRRRNVLPKETANHVPVILAMTIVSKNAREYGLDGIQAAAPVQYDAVEITAPTHLPLIADLADCTVAEVRELNPALLKNLAPAGYSLRVPKETGAVVSAALGSIAAERRTAWRAHRLGDGETLAAVAQRYHTPLSSLLAANRALAGEAEPGDLLLIPAANVQPRAPAKRPASTRPVRRVAAHQPALAQRASN
jgi:membrane-bound lytic murein transglycosylase D